MVHGDLSNTWAGADTRPVCLVTFWRHRTGWLEVGRFFFDSGHLVNGYKHRFWNLPNVGRNPGALIPWKRVISVKALLRVPLDLMMEKNLMMAARMLVRIGSHNGAQLVAQAW